MSAEESKLCTDEGYANRDTTNVSVWEGASTYHQPDMGMKLLNYGFNVDFLSNQYGDFFIWRSPTEVYKPSPFTNMGREENNFHIYLFINYVNPENGTSHKIKGRFYYSADNIVRPTQGTSITDILGNMGTDAKTIQNIAGGDYSSLYPALGRYRFRTCQRQPGRCHERSVHLIRQYFPERQRLPIIAIRFGYG